MAAPTRLEELPEAVAVPNDLANEAQSQPLPSTEPSPSPSPATSSPTSAQARSIASRRIIVQGTVQAFFPPSYTSSSRSPTETSEAPSSPSVQEEMTSSTEERSDSDQPSRDSTNANGTTPAIDQLESLFATPAAQAVMLARLVSVAAASTAATLMPDSIVIEGQTIAPFPGTISARSLIPNLPPAGAPVNEQENSTRPRASSWLPAGRIAHRPGRSASSPPSSTLPEEPEEPDVIPVIVPRPSLIGSPMPSADASEGSFE
jgi:hypothetical protein